MKLDNVDVSKLKVADLPKFDKCPCELCDDGCFDRAGNKHHPECRREQSKRSKLPLNTRCPLSHYQATFAPAASVSGGAASYRRHPIPPPPDNEIPISFPHAQMSDISSQRDHYQPPPPGTVREPAYQPSKQKDNLALSRMIPMETQTHYQVEYVEKPVFPQTLRPLKNPTKDSQINITEPTAPLASQTTTRAHFKPWQTAPSQPFGEIPAAAGHILFPGSGRTFSTTSGSNFIPYTNVARTKPIVRLDINGNNLKASGSMDLQTNYRREYVTHELPSKETTPQKVKETKNEEKVYTRRPMNAISQTSFDYRPYTKHRPPLPANMEPFQSQITMGNPFTPAEIESKYRVDYPGYDITHHPREPPAAPKDHKRPYIPPTIQMDTLTVTQRDYLPIDINAIPRIRTVPLKPTLSVTDQTAPMETITTSRHHYKPYETAAPRRQYGELLPTVYFRPLEKFQGTTTTGETYQGRTGHRARPHIPAMATVHQVGEHDHNTNYRMEYQPHGLSLCAAKAYAIAQNKQTSPTPKPVSAQ